MDYTILLYYTISMKVKLPQAVGSDCKHKNVDTNDINNLPLKTVWAESQRQISY